MLQVGAWTHACCLGCQETRKEHTQWALRPAASILVRSKLSRCCTTIRAGGCCCCCCSPESLVDTGHGVLEHAALDWVRVGVCLPAAAAACCTHCRGWHGFAHMQPSCCLVRSAAAAGAALLWLVSCHVNCCCCCCWTLSAAARGLSSCCLCCIQALTAC